MKPKDQQLVMWVAENFPCNCGVSVHEKAINAHHYYCVTHQHAEIVGKLGPLFAALRPFTMDAVVIQTQDDDNYGECYFCNQNVDEEGHESTCKVEDARDAIGRDPLQEMSQLEMLRKSQEVERDNPPPLTR